MHNSVILTNFVVQLQYCKEIINLFIMNHSWHLTLKVNQDINQ
ncbi:hypothetical protein HMPREF2141_00803 [Bacteroides uniformis]|nr:hypothetical protein HMPREF2141_00803 [Bacteroides uniformis]